MDETYDEPTVQILIDLAVPRTGHPDGWEWQTCSVAAPSTEYVYTHRELCRVLLSYATLASHIIPRGKYRAFRVTLRGDCTGRLLAEWEWRWSAQARQYLPDGEPWCTWPERWELPDVVIRAQQRLGLDKPRALPMAPIPCGCSAVGYVA